MTDDRFIPYTPPRRSIDEMLERARSFYEELDARRSVRAFADTPVPREAIELAIRTASTAPSGAHRQPWRFIAISEPSLKRRIRQGAEAEEYESYEGGRMPAAWRDAIRPMGTTWQKPFLETAPWLVVMFAISHGVASDGSRIKNYYVQESCGIAAGMFITALHHMGLCTLTHTPSPMRFLGEILGRPANERPFMLFPVGYAADDCRVPHLVRKPLEEVAVFHEAPPPAPSPGP